MQLECYLYIGLPIVHFSTIRMSIHDLGVKHIMLCLMHTWPVQEVDLVTRLRLVLLMELVFDCRQMHQQQYAHYQARIIIAMHKYHHHRRWPVFYYLHEIQLKKALRSSYLYSGIMHD